MSHEDEPTQFIRNLGEASFYFNGVEIKPGRMVAIEFSNSFNVSVMHLPRLVVHNHKLGKTPL